MSKNIDTVLSILQDEVNGDVSVALQKMSLNYSMTWMYQGKKELFPESRKDVEAELKDEVYPIKGRKYEIKHIAEGEDVVMVELIESYPNPETKTTHTTPLVLVLEMEGEKIRTGRHYCDPRLSYKDLSPEILEKAYKGTLTLMVIE